MKGSCAQVIGLYVSVGPPPSINALRWLQSVEYMVIAARR